MEANIYNILKTKITELNNIHDEINLIEWNNEDGPHFESVEEMKEFENRVINGELDYILGQPIIDNINNEMIETFKHTINNYFFYIYTFKNDNDFITYLTIKDLDTNDVLNHLYGNKVANKELAHSYFEKLKEDITSNTLDYIFTNMIKDVDKNINILQNKYKELTNLS